MKYWGIEFKVVICFIISFSVISFLPAQELIPLQENVKELRSKGYAAQIAGDIDAALGFYKQAVALDPSYSILYNDIGIMYEIKGQLQVAQEYYLKGIKNDPNLVSAYSNLAFLYEEQKDYENAAYYWGKRVFLGDDNDPWTKKAKEHLADVTFKLEMSKNLDQEEDILTAQNVSGEEESPEEFKDQAQAVEQALVNEANVQDSQGSPDMMDSFLGAASEVKEENRELKEKLEVFSQALSEEKDKNKREKAQMYEQLATSYVQAKLYNEAIDSYKKALALGMAQPHIYYYLGLLYQYQRKDPRTAIECFREYLELDPYGKYNEKARDLINILQ